MRRSAASLDAGAPARRTAPSGGARRPGTAPESPALAPRSLAESRSLCLKALAERGVALQDLARLVLDLQRPYIPGLRLSDCRVSVQHVLAKREVCNAILTGLALDRLAEEGLLPEPLGEVVRRDDPLYGIDEVLALSVVNIYGTIGLTNFGYLDKVKPGVVGRTDAEGHDGRRVNTFLDDLLAAVAAAAASRLAHRHRDASGQRPGGPAGDGARGPRLRAARPRGAAAPGAADTLRHRGSATGGRPRLGSAPGGREPGGGRPRRAGASGPRGSSDPL